MAVVDCVTEISVECVVFGAIQLESVSLRLSGQLDPRFILEVAEDLVDRD